MRCCFGIRARRTPPPPSAVASEEENDLNTPSTAHSARSGAQSPTTINLTSIEYARAVHTQSYNEIRSKIHHHYHNGDANEDDDDVNESVDGGDDDNEDENADEANGSSSRNRCRRKGKEVTLTHLIAEVLHPDRESIQEALRGARPSNLTRLVSDYFDNSEHTSRLCAVLHRSIDRARSIYTPLHDVLELLPTTPSAAPATTDGLSDSITPAVPSHHHHHHHRQLSQEQCDWAFDKFLNFDSFDNPFPSPSSADSAGFNDMRRCFAELRQQLERCLRKAKRRIRLYGHATRGAALCLIVSAVGLAVAGLVIATHALVALVAGPPAFIAFIHRPADPLASSRKRLLQHITQLDAAARGAFVLNSDLDTIEALVSRLHATVESDKVLVRLGIERGRGDRHPIEEVVRQLRKNHPSFLHQLRDLEEHVCLCFAAVNRARSLLLQHIHHYHHRHRDR